MGPIETKIFDKLTKTLQPKLIEIVNDSAKHSSHGGVKDFYDKMGESYEGPAESHFSIRIVSDKFNGVNRLNRQRLVLDLIQDEMKVVHALALKTLTPEELMSPDPR
ncbi:MAG: BolA family transcriptional regulator [Caulobacterales bacterium]|nr:BolA family transcriptional regulator [Caulobacterales bacterium]MCA0372333.1 BolA family transcriptional regulator [Pseudomonadota bacterium]